MYRLALAIGQQILADNISSARIQLHILWLLWISGFSPMNPCGIDRGVPSEPRASPPVRDGLNGG
jgi:hypothetical protein